jgi:hypothetical protein
MSRWHERCESYGAAPVHSFRLRSSLFSFRRCLFFGEWCRQFFDRYRYSIHVLHGFLVTRRHLRTSLSLTTEEASTHVVEQSATTSLTRWPLRLRSSSIAMRWPSRGTLFREPLLDWSGSDAGIGVGLFRKFRINGSARQFETGSPVLNACEGAEDVGGC